MAIITTKNQIMGSVPSNHKTEFCDHVHLVSSQDLHAGAFLCPRDVDHKM